MSRQHTTLALFFYLSSVFFSLPAALNKVYDLLFVHAAQEAIWI